MNASSRRTGTRLLALLAWMTLGFADIAAAFTTPLNHQVQPSASARAMAPKYNTETQKWVATVDADTEGAYGPLETIVRNGPLPFIQRVINPGDYEQGVFKLMASEKMGRKEAQGNMDASLENAADWAYQRLQERKGAAKKDYAKSPSTKQFALAGTWSLIVFWFFGSFGIQMFVGK
jgi:hypothetical protein